MMLTGTNLALVLGVSWVAWASWKYMRYEQLRVRSGCAPLKRYPGWDRLLGLDYVYSMMKSLKHDEFLEFQTRTYSASGSKVWTTNFLGNRMIYSSESENMKALSTSRNDQFGVVPIRVGNGASKPFTAGGVSTSDGAKWQVARDLVKPYFERACYHNLDRLRGHMDRLMSKIPIDGSTVDMQPLFQRWVSVVMSEKKRRS